MSSLARHRAPPGPWRQAWQELLAAVLPVSCAGCGLRDVGCCPRCRAFLAATARPWAQIAGVHPQVLSGLTGYALCRYGGSVSQLLTAWKDQGRTDLTQVVGAGIARAALPLLDGGEGLLVPVPASPKAARRRGGDLLARATRLAARRLTDRGHRARSAPLLAHTGAVQDQSGLSAAARRRNVHGKLVVPARARLPGEQCTIVLVDDVVTTGATLAEAVRALRAVGLQVSLAAALAATPLRSSTDRPAHRSTISLPMPG